MITVVLIAFIGVLMIVSALFSAVETAFFSLEPAQIRRLRARHPAVALRLEKLLETPRGLLSALLLADVCANLPLVILCLALIAHLTRWGMPFWTGAPGAFTIVVILCDLLPKMIALRAPLRTAALGTRLMTPLLPRLAPLCHRLQNMSDRFARRFAPDSLRKIMPLDEGELETLIQIGFEEGALQAEESEIIQELLKLEGKTAKDCLLPRIDLFAIPDDLTNEGIFPLLQAKRFRQVPVYAETPDQIVGMLDVKRFLLSREEHYTEALTPPSYIPATMPAPDLLRALLRHPERVAIVVDEFGGTEGIVTLSDMIEHIVSDAIPSTDHSLYIESFGPGRLMVAGSARLDDLSRRVGRDLEVEGIDTIGGLLFNHLGHLPQPGETVELHGLRITIRRASRMRIHELLITIPAREPEPEEDDDDFS